MKTTIRVLLLTAIILGAGLSGYAMLKGLRAPGESQKVAFYQDSMHPWIKSDKPGKCTICAMDLTPIHAGQKGFETDGVVALSSNSITVLHVQTEEAKRRLLSRRLRVAGTLEANETRKVVVSAPARGRIDELSVDYAGVEVQEGQKLIKMFSPELVQLRKTLLAVHDINQPESGYKMTKALVDSGIYTGDILAPRSGVVVERNVYSGQYVAEGDRLLTIADASMLWFRFAVYQDQLPWFGLGEPLEVEVAGVPGRLFRAVIAFLEPTLDEATRTIKVRAEIKNPLVEIDGCRQRLLKFGMYAEGRVHAQATNVLAIARSAILFPGGSAYAYVAKEGGAYERRRVKLGRQGDQFWEVLEGIEEGESVVTSGNTLIDAQAQFNVDKGADNALVEQASMVQPESGPATWTGVPQHRVATCEETEGTAPMSTAQMQPAIAMVGTKQMAGPPSREQGASRRTQLMGAIMSPGSELQLRRRAAILAEREAAGITNAPRLSGHQPGTIPSALMAGEAGTSTEPREVQLAMSPTAGEALATDAGLVTIAKANSPNPAAASLSQVQYQQIQALVLEISDISAALAADNLAQFKAHVARLPVVLAPVQKDVAGPLHWDSLLEPLAALSKAEPPTTLEQARKAFLPFSTGAAALVKQIRHDLPAFPQLKIYHCPMAPKPGLWVQTQAPLANPFYGKEMLRCGEEVKQ